MGQANKRKADKLGWHATLTQDEQIVADAAQLIHHRLSKTDKFVGACFFYAFFLRKYLRQEKGIAVTPVAGWALTKDVRSGQETVFGHGWADFGGKLIDISLTQIQPYKALTTPPGDLIVLDRIVASGKTSYTYFADTTPAIAAMLAADGATGQRRLNEVADQRERAADDAKIDAYFDDAPSEFRYAHVLTLLR